MRRDGFILLPTILLLAVLAAIAYSLVRQSGSSIGLESSELRREQAAMLAEAGLARAQWSANQANCINYAATGTKPLGSGSYQASFSGTSSSPVKITATGTLTDGSSQQRQIQAAIYSTEQKTGILQSANFVEATTIDSASPLTGAPGVLTVSGSGKRALFRIDNNQIDSIVPDGVYVESATLQFRVASTVGDVSAVSLYPVTSRWKSASASWTNAEVTASGSATAWQTPGGDFVSAAVSSANAAGVYATWDVTALVRGWKSQRLGNLGGVLALPAGSGAATLTAANLADNTQNPKLTVVYRCNCGDARCRFGIDTDQTLAYWVLSPAIDFGLFMTNKKAVLNESPILLETADVGHVVFKFDFANKPNIAEIVDVRLNLFAESGENISGALTASAYRIIKNWDVTNSGWDNQLVSQGVYYDATAGIGNATISSKTGMKSFYVAKDTVAGWLAGSLRNDGMTIFFPNVARDSPLPTLKILSMESGVISQRPQLVIAYLPN